MRMPTDPKWYEEKAKLEDGCEISGGGIHMIDCRSDEGVTIGLIDGIIAISRILADRDMTHPAVIEALKDIRQDDDFRLLIQRADDEIARAMTRERIIEECDE